MKPRFAIFDLILLFIPMAFGSLWIANSLQTKSVEWSEFSVGKLDEAISNGKSALVLGLPYITRGFNQQALAEFDHPAILRAFRSEEFVAMKCEYHTFTEDHGLDHDEMNWLTQQVNGSYKEIVLVRVKPDRSTEFERMFFKNSDILELLSLDANEKPRRTIYSFATIFSIAILSGYVTLKTTRRGGHANGG